MNRTDAERLADDHRSRARTARARTVGATARAVAVTTPQLGVAAASNMPGGVGNNPVT
jgi:hypothetical protein